jgi:methionine sulfoxide reductase heme-binding subunit
MSWLWWSIPFVLLLSALLLSAPGAAQSPQTPCIPSCTGDLCGQDNGCGEPCPAIHKAVCGRCTNPPCPSVCTPSCAGDRCGQPNGCGASCPSDDAAACGKCGNAPCCAPACEGARCGQDDGCGRACSDADKATCGVCGNAPCCVQEVCGDHIDNDCDGRSDEFCALAAWPALQRALAGRIGNDAQLIVAQEPVSLVVRISGLLALLFMLLSGLVGIYRFYFFRRYSRKPVINYHTYLGVAALVFALVHMGALLFDYKWNDRVTLARLLIPDFSTSDFIYMALGVFAFYGLLIVVLSGFTFFRLSKQIGYKRWLLIHQLSFVLLLITFWHAKKLGSDFELIVLVIFFVLGLALLFLQLLTRNLDKKHLRGLIAAATKAFAMTSKQTLASIQRDADVDKPVTVVVHLSTMRFQWGGQAGWYALHDDTSQLFGYRLAPVEEGIYKVSGTLRKSRGQYYIEIRDLMALPESGKAAS